MRLLLSLLMVIFILPSVTKAKSFEEAKTLLKLDIGNKIKILKSDINIYHYFWISQHWKSLNDPMERVLFAEKHYNNMTETFWDLDYHQYKYVNAGAGLYSAIDPLISEEFGNSKLVIEISKGTRVLDLVRPTRLSRETWAALKAVPELSATPLNKIFGKSGSLSRDTFKNILIPGYENLRVLLQDIVSELDIQILEYNWNTKLQYLCHKHSYSAFVSIWPLNMGNTREFTKVSMLSHWPLENLTFDEIYLKSKVENFKQALEKIHRTTPMSRAKAQSIFASFITEDSIRSEIINETYSCFRK